jgi:integrase
LCGAACYLLARKDRDQQRENHHRRHEDRNGEIASDTMKTQTRIGQREIRALNANEMIWDSAVKGFAARRQRGSGITYVLFYRTREGRQRWYTIGRHGSPWTPDTARDEARKLLGDVAREVDPAADKRKGRHAKTVADLCDAYLADAEAGRLLTRRKCAKKASTLATDRGRIERHIKPLLGRLPVAAVTRDDVDGFMHAVAAGETALRQKTKPRGVALVRGGKGAASRTVGLLGGIFSYAVQRRLRTDNPVHGVIRFADGKRERRLDDAEYRKLGDALRMAEAAMVTPFAIAAARFLALTGWRSGEALGLRWSEVDLQRRTARLTDTKTGFSMRPLSPAACNVLATLPRTGELAFAAARGDGRMTGFPKAWARIMKAGGLPADVTPHVLRHTFASLASDLGYSELTIGAMIGHRGHSVTSRYVHSADAVLLSAAAKVGRHIAVLMGDEHIESEILAFPNGLAA